MGTFDEQLSRLRSALGVKEDQEVAAALGMTKSAFSNRKRSRSFPEEHVVGLKARFPDLDVVYVLTGRRPVGHIGRVLDAQVGAIASAHSEVKQLVLKAVDVALADEEARRPLVEELVGLMPWCTDDDIRLLTQIAARLAGRGARRGSASPADQQRKNESAPSLAERDLSAKVKALSHAIDHRLDAAARAAGGPEIPLNESRKPGHRTRGKKP